MERMHFLLESRQVNLLYELQTIYPVYPVLGPGGRGGNRSSGGSGSGVSASSSGGAAALSVDMAQHLANFAAQQNGGVGADWELVDSSKKSPPWPHGDFSSEELASRDWAIRGLQLPDNLQSGGDDEVVYAALGCVVHVLTMISKYLMIPLRYQLVYAASRSQVRDRIGHGLGGGGGAGGGARAGGGSGGGQRASGGGQMGSRGSMGVGAGYGSIGENAYPLYNRHKDPERFKDAVKYLHQDIEQILWARRSSCPGGSTSELLRSTSGLSGGKASVERTASSLSLSQGSLPSKVPSGSEILSRLHLLFKREITPDQHLDRSM